MSILNVNQLQPVGGGNTITVGSSNIDYSGSITGNISVDGNLTVTGIVSHEDVTNIDSVGVVTARNGLQVTGGNVGINSTVPGEKLDVLGTIRASAGTNQYMHMYPVAGAGYFDVRNQTSYPSIVFRQIGSGGTQERLRITSGGLVGIGTDNPGSVLEVSGSGAVANVKAEGQTNARVRIQSGNTSSSYLEFGDSDDSDVGEIVYDHSDNSMRFRTNGSPHVYITSAGNFGVGTAVPATKLNVIGDTRVEGFSNAKIQIKRTGNTVANGSIEFLGSDDSFGWGLIANYDAGGSNFNIKEGSNSRFYIKSGNIGIGENNPSARLDVVGGGIACSGWSNNNSGASGGMELGWDGTQVVLQSIDRNGGGGFQPVLLSGSEVRSNSNIKFNNSGNGIDFSADPDASGRESELLDDYEHGTFTPTIKVEAQGSNAAIDNVSGTYVKVGKLVYAGFHADLNGVPSGRSSSAAIEFHGMPFTSLAEGSSGIEEHIGSVRCHPVDNSSSLGASSEFILRMFDNNTYGRIEVRRSNGDLANASLYMRDNMQISAAITYRTAS